MADSELIIVKEVSQVVEVKQSNQAPMSISVVTGPAGEAGRSIHVYVQAEEPTNPQPGDIWLDV